jgi:hypothetical protein
MSQQGICSGASYLPHDEWEGGRGRERERERERGNAGVPITPLRECLYYQTSLY